MSKIINNVKPIHVHTYGMYLPDPVWLRHDGGPEPIHRAIGPKCSLNSCMREAEQERVIGIKVCNYEYYTKVFFCGAHDPVELAAASTFIVQNIGEE